MDTSNKEETSCCDGNSNNSNCSSDDVPAGTIATQDSSTTAGDDSNTKNQFLEEDEEKLMNGVVISDNNSSTSNDTDEPPITLIIDHTNDPNAEEKSLEYKKKGNDYLIKGKYLDAIKEYSLALEYTPTNSIVLSNRSQAYIKVENYGLAVLDSTLAIENDPSYAKAYYRRASANFALHKYKLAKKDFKQVCLLKPKDKDARAKLKAVDKCIKEDAFAKAIQSEQTVPLSSIYNPNDIHLDVTSYNGPIVYDPPPNVGSDDMDKECMFFNPGQLPRSFVIQCVEHFKDQKLLHKRYVARLLISCKKYFESLSSLMRINIPNDIPEHLTKNNENENPSTTTNQDDNNNDNNNNSNIKPRITVCGDTHGQFYDVLNIFNMNGYPNENNPYVFNGDFVDRGSFSVEVILTFLLFKLSNPKSIYLTRGNHETKNMTKIYGFEGETKAKYDDKIFDLFMEVFQYIPLAAVIENDVFITHGGLPSDDEPPSLDDITKIKRGCEPSDSGGLMSDLLWSDPQPFNGKSPSKRGVGYSFGPDITTKFLNKNKLNLLVRSHEVKEEGYLVEHGGKTITVFSAPNYCDTMGNKGAYIHFTKGDNDNDDNVVVGKEFIQYEAVPHPDIKPMAYAAGMGGGGAGGMAGLFA